MLWISGLLFIWQLLDGFDEDIVRSCDSESACDGHFHDDEPSLFTISCVAVFVSYRRQATFADSLRFAQSRRI